jgi:cyclase
MCALHEAMLKYGNQPDAILSLDFESVDINIAPLTDGVALLTGLGGNVAVGHGPEGGVLVDDQFAQLGDKIKAAIAKIAPVPIRTVINTHWHIDHSGGNAPLAENGATILAHHNARKRLATGQRVDFANMYFGAESGAALPSETYDNEVTLKRNGDTIRIIHVPAAHTDGDTIVKWEQANVLHMGDVYVRYGLPFIDLSSGGTIGGFIAGVERGLALSDDATQIIPGHGALACRADMLNFRDGLKLIAAQVLRAKKSGESLSDCQKSIPIEGWPRPEGAFIQEVRPEVFIEFAWNTL